MRKNTEMASSAAILLEGWIMAMSEYINAKAFRQDLYYSDDAVNMGEEYKGLWVRWRAIEAAIEKHKVSDVQQVVHAKWLKFEDDLYVRVTCSYCNANDSIPKSLNDTFYWMHRNFCPNCGALMDLGKNN